MNSLKINDLSLGYGDVEVLKNINLDAYEGDITAILSPNGSGKTSLMHTLIGLIKPIRGNAIFTNQNGSDISLFALDARTRAKYVALISQNAMIQSHYSLLEFIMLGFNAYLKWYQTPNQEMRKKAMQMLERLEISHLKDRIFGRLSGGERQMAALGRALLQESKILLLDEPTSWLDLRNQVIFFEALKKEVRDRGLVALINIHDPYSIANYADYVYLLKDGMNLASGKPEEMLESRLLSQLYGLNIKAEYFKENKILILKAKR